MWQPEGTVRLAVAAASGAGAARCRCGGAGAGARWHPQTAAATSRVDNPGSRYLTSVPVPRSRGGAGTSFPAAGASATKGLILFPERCLCPSSVTPCSLATGISSVANLGQRLARSAAHGRPDLLALQSPFAIGATGAGRRETGLGYHFDVGGGTPGSPGACRDQRR